MAGSPVAIADQYDTIGDNLRFLTNSRLISLVREGFYAKPLSRDIAHSCKVYRFSSRKGSSAVEDMPVHDDDHNEIYTIGGCKVETDGCESLASGIYVVRDNGKIRKVLIK